MRGLRRLLRTIEYGFWWRLAEAAERRDATVRMQSAVGSQRGLFGRRARYFKYESWERVKDPWQTRVIFAFGTAWICHWLVAPHGAEVAEAVGGWTGLGVGLALALSPVPMLLGCALFSIRSMIHQYRHWPLIIGGER